MDPRERLDDPIESTLVAQDGHQVRIWTSIPGIIQSYDPATQTAVVQPSVKGVFESPDGSFTQVNMPLCVDVPVEFPCGGGFVLTFPVKKNDECMLDFCSRSFDAWWQSGGIQSQVEQRMHDLSDGICRVGVRSKPHVVSAQSATSTQLRSEDGTTYIEVKAGQLVNVVAPGGINLNGVTIDSAGNLHSPAAIIAGFGGADQVGLQTHKHPTAAAGAPSSPTAGT